MTVSLHIVTWNSRAFLPSLLRSIEQQTRMPDRILVVDNNSLDGTIDLLKEFPSVHVLRNTRNLGFARAHNQAIHISKSEAILVTNPDLILEPTCIEELIKTLEQNQALGSVCPKLLRFSFGPDDLREPQFSGTIDAAGMVVKRSRQVLNRGEGEDDHGQFDAAADVFGSPGVLALYRRSALNDVAIDRQYFDEDFFAYKEDADLAWRLQAAGWHARYRPTARAFHHRTLSHHGDNISRLVKTRKERSSLLRRLSYRNHLLMLMKNETLGTFLPHVLFILWYELRKLAYMIFREMATLPALAQAIHLSPVMLRKRRLFRDRRRVASSTLRKLFQA